VKPPINLAAITTPSGVIVICMLAGYILYAAWNRYDNVREDCRKMEELKVQAEAADVAKSQVKYIFYDYMCLTMSFGFNLKFFLCDSSLLQFPMR